ncbi:MAG TPA: hypothetical protein VF875_07760 [Anaeromyxobacter sp.]
MSSDPRSFLELLERLKPKFAARFPALKVPQVVAFMGTTSLDGTHASCSIHPLRGMERGPGPRDLRVSLGGTLPRQPVRGECLSVHMTRFELHQGYQVKTRALAQQGAEALLEPIAGGFLVRGEHIYTVHHSPYTLQFFEQVPLDELTETLAGVRHAIVAVGETANISPRFVFHHEVKDGKVLLFHGDGLALKTYMNIRRNRCETRLLVDPDDYTGFSMRGTVEEFSPPQHPEAYERVCQGFSTGGWGKPSRVFRFTADHFESIAPRG